MCRLALALGLIVLAIAGTGARAFEVEDRRVFAVSDPTATLRVISTTDTAVFAPTILAFQQREPTVAVDYIATSSTELMKALQQDGRTFDIAISSAMDLQIKLANDGLALSHGSAATARLPDWAKWRDRVFAFTSEPATVIMRRDAFGPEGSPRTRRELVEMLRRDPQRFRGRIGTYDVRRSGLGFLFATQDARNSEAFWRLMEVFGTLDAKLYCCSGVMIDAVAHGELLMAYNVLGSYVPTTGAEAVEVIELRDFTTVMQRTIIAPVTAEHPRIAFRFIDHVLQTGSRSALRRDGAASTWHRPIRLGPGLLTYLDRLKKKLFLEEWESAIEQAR